jgi:hypothetical protein
MDQRFAIGEIDTESLVPRHVASHWIFFFSARMSDRTLFDFCAAARNASRSAEPISGISRSITNLGIVISPFRMASTGDA